MGILGPRGPSRTVKSHRRVWEGEEGGGAVAAADETCKILGPSW